MIFLPIAVSLLIDLANKLIYFFHDLFFDASSPKSKGLFDHTIVVSGLFHVGGVGVGVGKRGGCAEKRLFCGTDPVTGLLGF